MSFSIDDVRDTFRGDVLRLVDQVDHVASELLAIPALATGAGRGRELFSAAADDGHALFGTASLVGADSLSGTARILEGLAARGRREIAAMEQHAERGRRIAELMSGAAKDLRAMLDLELDHMGADAQWLAMDLDERVRDLMSLLDAPLVDEAEHASLPPTSSADSTQVVESEVPSERETFEAFAFDELDPEPEAHPEPETAKPISVRAPASPAEDVGDVDEEGFTFEEPEPEAGGDFEAELRAVFVQEASEAVVALKGHLRAVAEDLGNLSALAQIERLFHTLKGASATVGLTDVGERAAALQHAFEDLVEAARPLTREAFESLVEDIEAFCALAGLPPIGALPGAEQKPPASSRTRALFLDEARRIHAEAGRVVDRIARAGDPDAKLVAELADLVHRLKGSALVAHAHDVAAEAEALERACSGEAPPTTAQLGSGLARIGALVGAAPALDAPDASEAEDYFALEAWQICDDVRAILTQSVTTADGPKRIAGLLHRLKGSALVAGRDEIARVAAEAEALCDGEASLDPAQGVGLEAAIARIESHLGGRVSQEAAAAPAAPAAPAARTRERVELVTDPELWQAFTQECADLLERLDKNILALEESDAPKQAISLVLRDVHTLKGVVNTIGLAPTGKELHRVEDFLEALLEARILPSMRAVASFLLRVQVDVRRNLKEAQKGWVETSLDALDARIASLLGRGRVARPRPDDDARDASQGPSGGSFDAPSGPSNVGVDEARRFIRVPTARLDALMNLAGELVISRSRLGSRVEFLRGLQLELGRGSRRLIETVDAFREEYEFARLDGRSAPSRSATNGASNGHANGASNGHANGASNGHANGAAATTWGAFSDLELDHYEDVHVLARRLAEITSDFTELGVQLARGLASFGDDADAFGGIVSGIQAEVTRARMVPLETLFARLRLPVRDAAIREGKDVRVTTEGDDVPVDKTIADALFQPMLHLVRNAVAHGIERPERRAAAGKPASGTLSLRARQESGRIVLEIADDGAGLDLAKLRARGVAMGLIGPEVLEDDPAVRDLVFEQGLSTTTTGEVAGRGIGCDVVRRAVERMNGSIVVESRPGRGTVFVVTLPVTLAITKALLVRQGKRTFAVPLYFAERILDVEPSDFVDSAGARRLKIDDAYVPVKRMSELVAGGESPPSSPVLVLAIGEQRLALQVDAVVAQEEIVVKGLGGLLAGHPLFAGVTIRGTGELVLILDVPRLFEGKGVAVRARLPRPADGVEAASDAPSDEAAPGAIDAPSEASVERRIRALFVDDSLSVRKVAEAALHGLGVDVEVAVDGLDALAKLREHTFDIVFTDLEMPRMHGYELIRELRFVPAYHDLPIVVVTSRSGQKHQDQARALGATDYLTKPFTPQTLQGALDRWARARGDRSSGGGR